MNSIHKQIVAATRISVKLIQDNNGASPACKQSFIDSAQTLVMRQYEFTTYLNTTRKKPLSNFSDDELFSHLSARTFKSKDGIKTVANPHAQGLVRAFEACTSHAGKVDANLAENMEQALTSLRQRALN